MAFVDPLRKDIYIACAAIWYDTEKKSLIHLPHNIKTGIVVCGYRHGNCFELLGYMFPDREYICNCLQGFLT